MKLKQKIFESTIPLVGRILRAYFRSPELVQFESRLEVKLMLKRSFSNILINKLVGDYFEFGLFQGRSFLYALESQQAAHVWGLPIHCHGFDSFEGLSGIESSKDEFHNHLDGGLKFREGNYAFSLKEFNLILKEHAVSQDRYTLHKGFFSELLKDDYREQFQPAAIVHIDCDLYSPTKIVLNFIKPLLQQGTIVLFDDYYCYQGQSDHGEAVALQEFLAENPGIKFIEWFNYHAVGKSFIVNLK